MEFVVAISQHQPRLYMHFFSQATLIHQASININIIRSRINQKINNLITKLTVHLNDKFSAIHLHVVHNLINSRNTMTNIPNYLRLLRTIDLRHTSLVQCKMLLTMIFSTYPTLQECSTITSSLLLSRLRHMSLLNFTELLMRRNILFFTYILKSSPLRWPFSFYFLISLKFNLARLRIVF